MVEGHIHIERKSVLRGLFSWFVSGSEVRGEDRLLLPERTHDPYPSRSISIVIAGRILFCVCVYPKGGRTRGMILRM